MKSLLIAFVALFTFAACNNAKDADEKTAKSHPMAETHEIFGDSTQLFENKMSTADVFAKYEAMNAGDSTQMVFAANINEVCKKKGCWMKLDIADGETARITFKDYGFFVPKDAAGKEAVVSGWAHKKETPVEDLKHYAEDAGKSQEEIDAITEPEINYTFVADAVLIKKES